MALPKDIPTLEHRKSKSWTRPDNIFVSELIHERLIKCYADPAARGPGADHFPIVTEIDMRVEENEPKEMRNFRTVDWKLFNEKLKTNFSGFNTSSSMSGDETTAAATELTRIIKMTIEAEIPLKKPIPHSKRWWTSELDDMKKKYNKLLRESMYFKELPDHPSHATAKDFGKRY
ncbi:hypothetical protein BDN72DRAFT_739379, partial [Pluteus cervinus]